MKPKMFSLEKGKELDNHFSLNQSHLDLFIKNLKGFWHYYSLNRTAVAGAIILAIIVLSVIFAPLLTKYDPNTQNLRERFLSFRWDHPFGTDQYGRDQFSRALYGGRVSLLVGFSSVTVTLIVGITLGLLSGFWGGLLDAFLMRFTDSIIAFPTFFLIVVISSMAHTTLLILTMIIGLTSWPVVARLVRAETLSIKEREFVIGGIVVGCSPLRIVLRYIIPNITSSIIVAATLQVAYAVLTEAALSFLGLGIQPPTPSWGNMLTIAQKDMFVAPMMAIVPGGLIFLTVLSLNFIGDGLRDSLDPRLRQR